MGNNSGIKNFLDKFKCSNALGFFRLFILSAPTLSLSFSLLHPDKNVDEIKATSFFVELFGIFKRLRQINDSQAWNRGGAKLLNQLNLI